MNISIERIAHTEINMQGKLILFEMRNCLKGYKSICNVPSFIFIHFLAMRLVRLK